MGRSRTKRSPSLSTIAEDKSCLDSNSSSNYFNSTPNSGEAKSKSSIAQLESQIHNLQNLIALQSLPVFHGRAANDNAVDWLTATERLFAYLAVPAADRVRLAATRLHGDASPWMSRFESRHSPASWSVFRHEFLRFFRPEALISAVCNLEQKRSLKEYEIEFLRAAFGGGGDQEWSEEELMNYFVGGLKEETRHKVEAFRPKTLADAMDFARNVEAGSA